MKGLIYCFLLLMISCRMDDKPREVGKEAVTATCERIIVCDTIYEIDGPRVYLMVSFKNHTKKRVYLITNKLDGGRDSKYFNAGVMLQTSNLLTPIGAFLNSNFIRIEPNSVSKLFFIYSDSYPNKWEEWEGDPEDLNKLIKLAQSIILSYHYDEKVYSRMDQTRFLKDNKGYILNEDIPIVMGQKEIEHRCDMTIDVIAEMVGGRVILGDTTSKKNNYKFLPDDYFMMKKE